MSARHIKALLVGSGPRPVLARRRVDVNVRGVYTGLGVKRQVPLLFCSYPSISTVLNSGLLFPSQLRWVPV